MTDDIFDDHALLPPPPPPPPAPPHRRRATGLGARGVTALVALGLMGGGLAGGYVVSQAATTSTTSPSTTTPSTSNGAAPTYQVPPNSGTVTAVGSNSVTIDGKTYAVTSSSDIDKNGEATLSNLAVGDKVTFSTVASASTPTIDKLHAGSEALDRPAGPPVSPQG